MRSYRLNSHSKYDLKVHLIWIPKYRKRVLTGQVAERARDILRQVCMEHEIPIVSGKVAADHVHMFVSYRFEGRKLTHSAPGIRAVAKTVRGRHLWARGYMATSSGNITDEMIQRYIEEQEGEIVDDGRFQIDSDL